MHSPTTHCSGPISRRGFLQVGSLAFGGLGLADLLRLQAMSNETGSQTSDTSVIFVWLPGGPPHMETYDMKPDAPADYRGDFMPISSNVPGLDVCELLPLHAKVADKFSLIRSIAHNFADHGGGHKRFLTGRDPLQPFGFVNDYPAVGSMVAKYLENRDVGLPNYISCMDRGRDGIDVFSFGSAYLSPATHPFIVTGDPNSPDFKVQNLALAPETENRLEDRVRLLSGLDQLNRKVDRNGMMDSMDTFNQRALSMLTSDKARKAFDLSEEPGELRDRYGRHPWGQRALMARRLVEAGASFVTVLMENPVAAGSPPVSKPSDLVYNWDSHAVNCHIFNDARYRLPIYDKVITALVEDLHNRGLDQKVLLIVTGEFGRTPRITYANDRPGRDHWPSAMSVLVSGGGLRMGQVVGSTTAKGETPKDRPLTPNDLWATALRHLGVDHTISFLDHRGRPMPMLPYGDPISELL